MLGPSRHVRSHPGCAWTPHGEGHWTRVPTAQAGVTRGALVPALLYWCGRCGRDRVCRSSLGLRDEPELQALSFHPRLLTWRASGGSLSRCHLWKEEMLQRQPPGPWSKRCLDRVCVPPAPGLGGLGHPRRLSSPVAPGAAPRAGPPARAPRLAGSSPHPRGGTAGAQPEGTSQRPRRPRRCQQTRIKTHLSDFSAVSWTESSGQYNPAALDAATPQPPAGRLTD